MFFLLAECGMMRNNGKLVRRQTKGGRKNAGERKRMSAEEGGLPKETYEEKHKQITNQRAELEQTAEKYKNIDADMK